MYNPESFGYFNKYLGKNYNFLLFHFVLTRRNKSKKSEKKTKISNFVNRKFFFPFFPFFSFLPFSQSCISLGPINWLEKSRGSPLPKEPFSWLPRKNLYKVAALLLPKIWIVSFHPVLISPHSLIVDQQPPIWQLTPTNFSSHFPAENCQSRLQSQEPKIITDICIYIGTTFPY